MEFFHVITALVAVIILFVVKKLRDYYRPYSLIPQFPSHFLLGHIPFLLGHHLRLKDPPIYQTVLEAMNSLAFMFRRREVAIAYLGPFPYIFVWRPQPMEAILSGASNLDKSPEYRYLKPWLGDSLLTGATKKWKSRRKLLTPSFHFKILEDFLPVMNEQSTILVNNLKSAREIVDIFQVVPLAALDVICETAMGTPISAQTNPTSEYVEAVKLMSESFFHRVVEPKYWFDFTFYLSAYGKRYTEALKTLHTFTKNVINQRKAEYIANNNKKDKENNAVVDENIYFGSKKTRRAFLDLLLEEHLRDPKGFTIEDVQSEVDTFMFEGHDTTAVGMSWTLYLLANYPEIQEKLYEELQSVFGDDISRPFTTSDLTQLKYLERVIKESLRLYPSVPIIARKSDKEVVMKGYKIPPNTFYLIFIYGLHREPDLWPQPEKFDPDRFLPENMTEHHPYQYVPFSAGPRNCIGQKFAMMEMKTLIAHMILHYRLEALVPENQIPVSIEIIVRPKAPLNVRLHPRT